MRMRRISWIKAEVKEFEAFPLEAKQMMLRSLKIATEREKADIAKPTKGLGLGVFEIALRHQTNAYRVVYAVQIGDDVWGRSCFLKEINNRD